MINDYAIYSVNLMNLLSNMEIIVPAFFTVYFLYQHHIIIIYVTLAYNNY